MVPIFDDVRRQISRVECHVFWWLDAGTDHDTIWMYMCMILGMLPDSVLKLENLLHYILHRLPTGHIVDPHNDVDIARLGIVEVVAPEDSLSVLEGSPHNGLYVKAAAGCELRVLPEPV